MNLNQLSSSMGELSLLASRIRFAPRGRIPWLISLIVALALVALAATVISLRATENLASPLLAKLSPLQVRLAYVHDGDAWVLDLASGTTTRVTTNQHVRALRWTTDGQSLFFTEGNGVMMRWRADEGAKVVQSGLWSPDGTAVAFTRPVAAPSVATSVWIKENGHQVQITPSSPVFRWEPLAWSVTGHRLALARIGVPPTPIPTQGVPPTSGSLWITAGDAVDGRLDQLPPAPSATGTSGWPDAAYWSPDNRFLVVGIGPNIPCASCRADGLPFFSFPTDGSAPMPLTSALTNAGALAWAPRGSSIVISAPGGRETYVGKHIVRFDPATGLPQDLTNTAAWSDVEPAPSPDGSLVAFARGQSASNRLPSAPVPLIASRQLWIVHADGSQAKQLTSDASWTDEGPRWSPNGQWIVFVRWHLSARDQSPHAELWAIRPDGSGEQRLVANLDLPLGFNRGFGYYGAFDWSDSFAVAPTAPAPKQTTTRGLEASTQH